MPASAEDLLGVAALAACCVLWRLRRGCAGGRGARDGGKGVGRLGSSALVSPSTEQAQAGGERERKAVASRLHWQQKKEQEQEQGDEQWEEREEMAYPMPHIRALGSAVDPLSLVRETTGRVVDEARHVRIVQKRLEALARDDLAPRVLNNWNTLRESVAWDAGDWHYSETPHQGKKAAGRQGPRVCQYVLVLDALNFCFWPTEGAMEYEQLARGLKDVLQADPHAFDAARLATLGAKELQAWFPDIANLPQVEERVNKLREVGQALLEHFDGQAMNLVKAADRSAVRLVRLITQHLPGFRDSCIYNGRQVFLYKRAQIFVGDVWAAYGRQRGTHPMGFYDMNKLTAFADYRIPQLLRHLGVLEYSEDLARRIDAKEQVQAGAPEEVEIRAATIVATNRLHRELDLLRCDIMPLEIDWLLWQQGEEAKDEIPPHHRTLTVFY